jgi:hypothetical protein
MDEIEFKEYTVTCETSNCGNFGHAIPLQAPVENPNFICGVCKQPITNVVG